MFEQTIETSATPHVTVAACGRHLAIRGKEGNQVTIRAGGDEEDVTLEQEGEALIIIAPQDCEIACPAGSTITIREVGGKASIEDVGGPVAVGSVGGSLHLEDVGPVEATGVGGNLNGRRIAGDLKVQDVGGNAQVSRVEGSCSLDELGGSAAIRRIAGDCTIADIGGNLAAEEIEGDLAANIGGNGRVRQVGGRCSLEVGASLTAEGIQNGLTADVGGSARLGPPFTPGATYRLDVGGSLEAFLPADASLAVALEAGGGVHSSVPDLALEGTGDGREGILGNGEASLEVDAGGAVTLREGGIGDAFAGETGGYRFLQDLEGIGAAIETRVAEAMSGVAAQLEESLGRVDSARIQARVEQITEGAVRFAEQAASQVRREAEREAERARMRAERAERRWQRASGRQPRSRPDPATSEEQLRILRMVEENKITPEQAADLLEALGGR